MTPTWTAVLLYFVAAFVTFAFRRSRAPSRAARIYARAVVAFFWPLYLVFLTVLLAAMVAVRVASVLRPKRRERDPLRDDVLTFGLVATEACEEVVVTHVFEDHVVLTHLLFPEDVAYQLAATSWLVEGSDLLTGPAPLVLFGPTGHGFPLNFHASPGQRMRLTLRNVSTRPLSFELKAKVWRKAHPASAR